MQYPMHADLKVGSQFPEFELPDTDKKTRRLSTLLGGFPGILTFIRGSF